jgi:carbonic anhydrase
MQECVPLSVVGVVQSIYPSWGHAFWDQLEIAKGKLHKNIHTIILLEHHFCGAYRTLFDNDTYPDDHHEYVAEIFAEELKKQSKHPLELERYVMVPTNPEKTKWKIESLKKPEDTKRPPKQLGVILKLQKKVTF